MKLIPRCSTALAIRTGLTVWLISNSFAALSAQNSHSNSHPLRSATGSSQITSTPSAATTEVSAKKQLETATNGGNGKPVAVEPAKKVIRVYYRRIVHRSFPFSIQKTHGKILPRRQALAIGCNPKRSRWRLLDGS